MDITLTNISELICELNSRYCSRVKRLTSEKACWTNALISRYSTARCSWFMGACAARFLGMLSVELWRTGVAVALVTGVLCCCAELLAMASEFLNGM